LRDGVVGPCGQGDIETAILVGTGKVLDDHTAEVARSLRDSR
jgi:hypothetical protein